MHDISNKLHALVDEFVTNLSSECDSLANNICSKAGKYEAPDIVAEAAKAPRLSNRTTTEVLNGLRRPFDNHLTSTLNREEKTHVSNVPSTLMGRNIVHRDGGLQARPVRNMKVRSQSMDEADTQTDVKSIGIGSEYTPSAGSRKHGVRNRHDMASIGKFMEHIEILSSDQSSDDCRLANLKSLKGRLQKQSTTMTTRLPSRGRPTTVHTQSSSMSRENSHFLNYNYDEDTTSLGGRSQAISSTFQKLPWPVDEGDEVEGGLPKKREENNTPSNKTSHKKSETEHVEETISFPEGDESNEDYLEGNPPKTDADGEELPVLPKVPVKRKSLNEAKTCERRTHRGRPKSASPQTEKQKTPTIDASVITQLTLGARPQNYVSNASFTVWHSCIVDSRDVGEIECQL